MKTACAVVWKYFDGLCLDCMDHTQPKFADEHEDYWCHLERDMEWDNACRIDHGQATWYYSFSMFLSTIYVRATEADIE
jgi:hypothetical protein